MEGLHLAHLGYTHTQTHTQKDMLYGISKHSGTRAHAGTANTSTQSYRPIRSLPTVFHSNIQSHIKASTLSHTHTHTETVSGLVRHTDRQAYFIAVISMVGIQLNSWKQGHARKQRHTSLNSRNHAVNTYCRTHAHMHYSHWCNWELSI